MNKRDAYIIRNVVRAEALRDCAISLPKGCENPNVPGTLLRDSFMLHARMCDDRVAWASLRTPAEFNAERHKP